MGNVICCASALVLTLTGLGQSVQKHQGYLLPADQTTVIRFFYTPPLSYAHPPLLLQAVDKNDPRLNTAPMLDEGRIAYITVEEMQRVIEKLIRLNLHWLHSPQHASPERIASMEVTGRFAITAFSTQGTASSLFDPKNICANLEALDAALRQPRAMWQINLFRTSYGCQVMNFDRDRYPDHEHAAQ